MATFSKTWTLYRDLVKIGLLSFTSITLIIISKVPDRGGFPPSTAISINLITACFSRSKAFCSTNSAVTLCSSLCTSREKYSFGLRL
uniref:Uncharacterized protein n=1 Tax=Oncorhynchus kisutch TaxID=8019 RepID=A0A8C7FJ07_ONCKI